MMVTLLSLIPVYVAQRLTREAGGLSARRTPVRATGAEPVTGDGGVSK
jgi:hypothetical protein